MSHRRHQDAFGKKARRGGYLARSVYKLEEIDRRIRLFRQGQRVLDLGAHPGSWTQYASQKVGTQGFVLGVDLTPTEAALPPNAKIICADAFGLSPEDLGEDPFDVVMSDMAPATTGQKHLDQFRSHELAMRALEVARELLKPDGTFVTKIFQGPDFQDARKAVADSFKKVRVIRPKATRTESYETFLVGLGRK